MNVFACACTFMHRSRKIPLKSIDLKRGVSSDFMENFC